VRAWEEFGTQTDFSIAGVRRFYRICWNSLSAIRIMYFCLASTDDEMPGRWTSVKYWYTFSYSANKTFRSKYFTNHYTVMATIPGSPHSMPIGRRLKVNWRPNSIFASWAPPIALYTKSGAVERGKVVPVHRSGRSTAALIFNHAPAAWLPGNNAGTHYKGGWVGPRSHIVVWVKKKSLSSGGIQIHCLTVTQSL